MAEVFLAVRRDGSGGPVALKRILSELQYDPNVVQSFLDEARLAGRVDHPGVVKVFDSGRTGRAFIVMEYLPGRDLRTVQDTVRAVGVDAACALVARAAAALHAVHELADSEGKPLFAVHRDVSPGNLVACFDGRLTLVDFGIAKIRSMNAQTTAGTFKGKVSYASPEQADGYPVDRRSDVFCLGIVLWELLAGRPLFDRPTMAASLRAICSERIPPPSTLRRDVPAGLDAAVLRMLDRVLDARPETAAAAADALEPYVGDFDLGAWMRSVFGGDLAQACLAIAGGSTDLSIIDRAHPAPSDPGAATRPGLRRGDDS
jgi:serine/threonine protein kinase